MPYTHQPQLSINSIQSLVEPVTPPLGQMNNKQNHQRTNSLDLSGFNQFMASNSPINLPALSPMSGGMLSSVAKPRISSLPLITEFDTASVESSATLIAGETPYGAALPALRSVSGSTVASNAGAASAGAAATARSSSSVSSATSASTGAQGCNPDLGSLPIEELDYLQLATDQYGCRFLQRKLENPAESNQVRDLMYSQIKPYLLDLILDPFGNYLIQKLCEYLTLDQKTSMIQDIYTHVFEISINQYGTRSLQKIIDTTETEQHIDMIVSGFSQQFTSINQVVTLINDLNGNHVIQKCIFKFQPTKFDFIIDAIVEKDNIIKISTHKHGCCVLQKLLSVCTLQQIFKISVKIIQYLPGLINDQFGNYIIQFLFDIKELDFYLLGEIFSKLSHELCQLSCLKFSSNVVEKFIKKLFQIVHDSLTNPSTSPMPPIKVVSNSSHSYQQQADDVVNVAMGILLTITDIFTANLNVLIRDNFGNYALQTLLDVKNYTHLLEIPGNNYIHSSPRLTKFSHEFTLKVGNLIVLTKELLPSIKTTSYAKKIKLKVKAYAELTGVSFTDLSPKKGQQNVSNGLASGNSATNGGCSHRKQHARHYSLPANSFRHQRSNSTISLSGGYHGQQGHPQQQVNMMRLPQKLNFNMNQLPQQQHMSQQAVFNQLQTQQQHVQLVSTPHQAMNLPSTYQQQSQMPPQPEYLSMNFTNATPAYASGETTAASFADPFTYEQQQKQQWHQHRQQQLQQQHSSVSHMRHTLSDAGLFSHQTASSSASNLMAMNSGAASPTPQQPMYLTNAATMEYDMHLGNGFYR
ncbi:AaceriADL056Wp [[Ashbya] aceris (nom. inval.)]|nr:AaceriADL056Wp [[Ashbya] aceris (nom. inval.)]